MTTIFTEPIIRFTDNPAEVTAGCYRDDCGYLASAESDCVQESSGVETVFPRFSTPDLAGKLPTMQEIFTAERMQAITGREPIDLTGWMKDEPQEWTFGSVSHPIEDEELDDVSG